MGRAEHITSVIKSHDYMLYCERSMDGKLCVYRKGTRVETYYLDDSTVVHSVRSTPHFIFALTDTWKMDGRPVDWGIEPIMARLKAIDLWNRDLAGEIEEREKRDEKSRERAARNSIEDFLYDFRSQFKKTFNDVNTASLDKRKRVNKKSFQEVY